MNESRITCVELCSDYEIFSFNFCFLFLFAVLLLFVFIRQLSHALVTTIGCIQEYIKSNKIMSFCLARVPKAATSLFVCLFVFWRGHFFSFFFFFFFFFLLFFHSTVGRLSARVLFVCLLLLLLYET